MFENLVKHLPTNPNGWDVGSYSASYTRGQTSALAKIKLETE